MISSNCFGQGGFSSSGCSIFHLYAGNVSGKGTDRLSKKGGQTLVDSIGRWPTCDRRHEHAGTAEGNVKNHL